MNATKRRLARDLGVGHTVERDPPAEAKVVRAAAAMQIAQPFTGVVEVRITRRDTANKPRGLVRDVIVGGAGAPRIQSL